MKFNCISLLFHFSFFFLFCFVFNPEFFFSDFWVRKNSRSIIFLNFFLSSSLPLSLSLSLSLSFILTSPSLVHTILLTRISFFSFFLFASFIPFFCCCCCLSFTCTITRSLASRIFRTTHFVFFFTPFKSQLRY